MLNTHHGQSHGKCNIEDLCPDLYAPTLDNELVPSLGIAIAGVLEAYVLVWLLTMPFVPL
jgi:hypothetical protein